MQLHYLNINEHNMGWTNSHTNTKHRKHSHTSTNATIMAKLSKTPNMDRVKAKQHPKKLKAKRNEKRITHTKLAVIAYETNAHTSHTMFDLSTAKRILDTCTCVSDIIQLLYVERGGESVSGASNRIMMAVTDMGINLADELNHQVDYGPDNDTFDINDALNDLNIRNTSNTPF